MTSQLYYHYIPELARPASDHSTSPLQYNIPFLLVGTMCLAICNSHLESNENTSTFLELSQLHATFIVLGGK